MTLNILIAPSGFKESLDASDVAQAIADGVKTAMPNAHTMLAPLVDGGEGFTRALCGATGGDIHCVEVTGPVGEPVQAHFGFLGGKGPKTAVIEMAAAAGLALVPRDRRNPMLTTSYGVGELIRAALDAGARRILFGCGDSGVNDGGAGMAEALGVRFLDARGAPIARGGGGLLQLAHIDVTGRDPRLSHVRIDAAVNWHNVLLGSRGVARVFAPQKGASAEQVEVLDRALGVYAARLREATGLDVSAAPGCGASGGLGAGLCALLGATLHPRYEIVMQYLAFDSMLQKADLVITAEGCLDEQTPFGKIPAEVARQARKLGIPVVALAGTIGRGKVRINFEHGIDAFASILKRPCTIEEAIAETEKLLRRAAEDAIRMIGVGLRLGHLGATS